MSKAIELDKLHGIDPDAAEQQAVVIVLEAFYHAARAAVLFRRRAGAPGYAPV